MANQSSEISLLTFSKFADTVERRYLEGASLVRDLEPAKSLYMVESIPNGTGDRRIYTEIDGETYARYKAEGADATKTEIVEGWTKTMYNRRFAAEIDITYEARTYGKNQEILRKLTSLATFCPQRMAIDLTHRLTFATATSYTDMDGETVDTSMGSDTATALVDATQDLTGTSTTYSTVITGNPAFSQGGLEVALGQANTQILTNFGERRVMNFPKIVTGDDPATVRQVRQLLQSMSDGTQNNPGVVNVYDGTFQHVVLPRLATTATGAYDSTKSKYWFLVSDEAELHLGIWEAPHLKQPAPSNNGEDAHNDNWVFGTRCGYGICVPVARGVLGSSGSGS